MIEPMTEWYVTTMVTAGLRDIFKDTTLLYVVFGYSNDNPVSLTNCAISNGNQYALVQVSNHLHQQKPNNNHIKSKHMLPKLLLQNVI